MDESKVIEKFGDKYFVNEDTYHMGIHHALGDEIAKRFFGHKVCLDSCSGAGLMTIPLSKYVEKVIAVDISQEHITQASRNIHELLKKDNVELIQGDVLKEILTLEFDCAFLDPDWVRVGESKENHVEELSEMVPPADTLLQEVFKKTNNVCLRLPKNFDVNKLSNLPIHEREAVFQNDQLKFFCIYFGDLIRKQGNSELRL